MPKKGTIRRIKKRKNKSLKRKIFQKGGSQIHYIISSHGSTYGVNRETDNKHPNRKLFTYVDYGQQLDINCGYNLQHWLSNYRDPNAVPSCQEYPPYITQRILNARVYVEKFDSWRSGIVDSTYLGSPRVVENWTYTGSKYDRGFTLQDALDTIDNDFKANYNPRWDYNVHILTCLS